MEMETNLKHLHIVCFHLIYIHYIEKYQFCVMMSNVHFILKVFLVVKLMNIWYDDSAATLEETH